MKFDIKTEYILEKDLAGAMFWALDLDDWSGKFCDQGKFPLISLVKSEFKKKASIKQDSYSYDKINKPLQKATLKNLIKNEMNYRQNTVLNYGYMPIAQNTQMNYEIDSDQIQFKCKREGVFADRASGCRKYYECLWLGTPFERAFEKECPEDTLFNEIYQVCDWIQNVNC
jgi:GH18 family chitinase